MLELLCPPHVYSMQVDMVIDAKKSSNVLEHGLHVVE